MSSNNEYQTEENDKGGHFLAMAMTSSKLFFSEEKDKKTDLLDEVKIQGGGIGCCDCGIKIFVVHNIEYRTFCHKLSWYNHKTFRQNSTLTTIIFPLRFF